MFYSTPTSQLYSHTTAPSSSIISDITAIGTKIRNLNVCQSAGGSSCCTASVSVSNGVDVIRGISPPHRAGDGDIISDVHKSLGSCGLHFRNNCMHQDEFIRKSL